MEFVKKHKLSLALIFVVVLVIVVFVLVLQEFLFSFSNGSLYGNRLSGIESVEVTTSELDSALEIFDEDEVISSSESNVRGKIINITLKINEEIEVSAARELSSKLLGEFDEDVLNFYDIQLFIDTESESEMYPIIAYKHKTSEEFMWTYYNEGGEDEEE